MESRLAGASRPLGLRAQAWRVAVWWALCPMAMAASVPWTPSVTARHAIEILVDDGGLPLTVSQWPLPRDAVQRALDTLPADLPPNLDAARAVVRAELRARQASRIALTVRDRSDALTGFGDDATPGSSLQLRSGELDGPHLAMQIGGRLDPVADSGQDRATARLDDSALAVDAFGIQAQAWAHRSWWGTGWQSALPLGNTAPAFDGIGFQRAAVLPSESPWLSWLGPWNVDFFLARSEGESPQVKGSDAFISGTRLTFRPFSHVELGLTRMVQFGGVGRRESLAGFGRALLGRGENADTLQAQSEDSGNGLAGYDLRVRCPDGVRCAVYGQFIGEDEAGYLPTKFLNLIGAETWSADGENRLYVEAVETGCRDSWRGSPIRGCAYRNYAFPGGFTSANRWIGASVGPDARLLTLGWINSAWDSAVRLDFGTTGSRIGVFGGQTGPDALPGHVSAVSLRRSWHLGSASITPEFDWYRQSTANDVRVQSRAGIEFSVSPDELGTSTVNWFGRSLAGDQGASATTRVLAATALIGGSALFDRAAESYAYQHRNEPSLNVLRRLGSALPIAEFGIAGVGWLALPKADSNVALASVEAGLTSVAMSEAFKRVVDRSRPGEGRGAADFGHEQRAESSFPSVHSALAWSVLTPIAQRYDAPWLYGVAALTNVGRVAGRNHWFSDTVAGSVLGYVVGDWFGKRADADGTATTVMLVARGAVMSTTF